MAVQEFKSCGRDLQIMNSCARKIMCPKNHVSAHLNFTLISAITYSTIIATDSDEENANKAEQERHHCQQACFTMLAHVYPV